ncbi:MAG: lactate racemase domain-containing protein [Thermodesulfobacteriota bacterium]|nr:lactate racemase domain-containing protein [Thermodesulfobacteriota bacterium]
MVGKGFHTRYLSQTEVEAVVTEGLAALPLDEQRVLVILPDRTRTMPLPIFFRAIVQSLLPRVKELNFLVALGTHPPIDETEMLQMVGLTAEEKATQYSKIGLFNHNWEDPRALTTLGMIPAEEVAVLTQGLLTQDVSVQLNRMILEHDHLLICGPVFPHEVVGFSGGNKYFFPGIAGSDIINLTHWLGALVTSYKIIGAKDTPVRRVIDRAAALIPKPRQAICSVVSHQGVNGVYIGAPEEAYSAAADLSSATHIVWVNKPFRQVLSVMPSMYDDIWTGAKGMYKVEPAIADGGEVIIYAPHITEISYTHGQHIRKVGYHVRDYFLKQWGRFADVPLSILAHSTHLRGMGAFENGVERPRIKVTLATGIPEELCRQVNLGYRDPATIRIEEWAGREAEGVLLVPRAGEDLYRVKGN